MSSSPPTPPADLPEDVVELLDEQSPERLRTIAEYAEALAEHREREARLADAESEAEGEREGDESEAVPSDRPTSTPEGVPSKATLTVKEINDNRYYYWQWREGDRIVSEYEGPVDGE